MASEDCTMSKKKFQPSMFYDFSNERRGKALIFNQVKFDKRLGLVERKGSDVDVESLKVTLKKLQFHEEDIKVHTDLKMLEILLELEDEAKNIDENCQEIDCLIVVMMTHSNSKGQIYAFDKKFAVRELWSFFDGKRCKGLIGKPKLFFVQASSGLCGETPTKVDTLCMYSSVQGFSFRDPINGTLFIQTLCEKLNSHHAEYDLLTILTFVMNKIVYEMQVQVGKREDFENCEEYDKALMLDGAKQLPHISSLLPKLVFFAKK